MDENSIKEFLGWKFQKDYFRIKKIIHPGSHFQLEKITDEEGQIDASRWIATALLRYGRWDEAAATTEEALARLPAAAS